MSAHAARVVALGMWGALTSCAWTSAPDDVEAVCAPHVARASSTARVRIERGVFVDDSGVFVPRGIGSYPLLELSGVGRDGDVLAILDDAVRLGRPLVRTNAFFDGGTSRARLRNDDGSLHEPGFVALDRVLAAARARGVRLLLVLANHWADYGGAPAVLRMVAPGEALPVEAFYRDPRAIAAQQAYLRALVSRTNTLDGTRYAEDPAVFAWELANEPRCDVPELCAAGTLTRWARAMSTAIRVAGATQPIAWGGVGRDAEHGEDLTGLVREGGVEILTLHVYPGLASSLETGAVPAGPRALVAAERGAAWIRDGAAAARALGVPLLVEELGWATAGGDDTDGERALVLRTWLETAREQRVGALPWMIGEPSRPDYDGYLVRPFVDRATTRALCE